MGSGPTTTTNQSQVQNTNQSANPWAPAIPGLTNQINTISGLNTGVSPWQSQAISQLGASLSGVPNYAAPSEQTISNLFGYNTQPQQGMLGSAYNSFLDSVSPLLNPNSLNPMSTPGFSNALGAINQNITNQTNQAAAAAGVTPSSPEYAKALSMGLATGEAPTIAQQYNANVGNLMGAASGALGAAGSTASGLTTQQEQELQSQLQGLSATGQLPGLLSAAPAAYLQAANTAYGLPFSNVGAAENLLMPLGAMGGTSTGTQIGSGTSTTQTSQDPFSTALGVGLLGAGLFGKFSDIRLKDDIKPVGLLFNGAPVFSYSYRDDPERTPEIGLLAQDVMRWMPEAVGADPATGYLKVDYDLATQGSA